MAKTVFILGAGASCTYGLPTAQDLTDCIRHNPVPTSEIYPPLTAVDYKNFRSALTRSGRTSIDAFLETRSDLRAIGKFAIACTLLPLERTEALFDEWPTRRVKAGEGEIIPGHWYELLFDMLTGGRTFGEITFADLGIITFNYDRSLEHYLHTAVRNSYGKTDKEAADKLNELRLIHVYGSLGRLPWQPSTTPVVPYGSSGPDHAKQATDSLKILDEATRITPEFEEAHGLIAQAKYVYFLGFGFHEANLKRLRMEGGYNLVFFGGTIMGLTIPEILRAKRKFRSLSHMQAPIAPGAVWQDKDIYNYLRDHVSL